jgi:hypothetical protein
VPQAAWSKKRERQYEHVKESELNEGRSLRSHSGPGGRTYRQLYAEAQKKNIKGRSSMNKKALEKAVDHK